MRDEYPNHHSKANIPATDSCFKSFVVASSKMKGAHGGHGGSYQQTSTY